ncbi:hypothetical protein OSSY52_21410 [Tepiditoga spiralis]|uniref:Uncharacterized protein n=1 Tax=Tepiditoga spiralis TaxID=2108365 RepID=A0A7G1G5W5_9BACT|nr:HD domain-containing phosphohydrolase [Tepiditoga spiralis]BBE32000.1 hypothetical protein OSSY52_21410 [Tepiditoga spiralis]
MIKLTLNTFVLKNFKINFIIFTILVILIIFLSIFLGFEKMYETKASESANEIVKTFNFFINKKINFIFDILSSKTMTFRKYPANLDENTIISIITNNKLKTKDGYIDLSNWINDKKLYKIDSGIFFNKHTLKILRKEQDDNYLYAEICLDKILDLLNFKKDETFYLCNSENIILLSNNNSTIGKNIENWKNNTMFLIPKLFNKYVFFIKKEIPNDLYFVYTVSLNSFFKFLFFILFGILITISIIFFKFYNTISSKISFIVDYISEFSMELSKFDKNIAIKETINIKNSNIIELDKINTVYINLIENLQSYSEELSEKYLELNKLNKELYTRNSQILLSLSKGIELKDKYTLGHSKGVLELTKYMMNQLNLKKDTNFMQQVEIGCILHDIGKIFIPDEILNKPGKLSKDEFKEIKKHPQYGYELLKPISNLQISKNIIKYHHENWNGSGYPEGLNKNEIPLEAQIVAYADMYDAIRNKRVYHNELSKEESIKLIKSVQGIKLNPDLFNAFLKAVEIYEKNREEIKK